MEYMHVHVEQFNLLVVYKGGYERIFNKFKKKFPKTALIIPLHHHQLVFRKRLTS